jgi:hypothetical protein
MSSSRIFCRRRAARRAGFPTDFVRARGAASARRVFVCYGGGAVATLSGMSDSLPAESPLPLRRLLFMPWRWNRVAQGLLLAGLALLPLCYLISCPLIDFWASELTLPSRAETALKVYFVPAGLLHEHVPFVEEFFEFEFWLLESVNEYFAETSVTIAQVAD